MNPKNSYDAIVVGAGPAGSTVAYILASKGFKVLMLDKHTFPRSKLCGGLLTWKTINLLQAIFKLSPAELQAANIISGSSSRYRVTSHTGAFTQGRLRFPFHFVQRRIYDHFWLQRARQAGAEFVAGQKVLTIDPPAGKVIISSGNQYCARFIFGADGALSRIRTALIKKQFIREKVGDGLATAMEIFADPRQSPQLPSWPTIYFGYIHWGYAWCFPGKNTRILGICTLNAKSGKLLRSSFGAFLKSHGLNADNRGPLKGCALPYGNFLTRPGHDNILLVGDAGGLADPLLGEGIYYAHKSAQLAAHAAMQTFHHPPDAAQTYSRHLDRSILRELKYIRAGRRVIFSLPPSCAYHLIALMLGIMPRKCEETLQGQRSFRWLRLRSFQ